MKETVDVTIRFTDVPKERMAAVEGLIFAVSALAHGIQDKVRTAPRKPPSRKPARKGGRAGKPRQVEERSRLLPSRTIVPPKAGGVKIEKIPTSEALKNLSQKARAAHLKS